MLIVLIICYDAVCLSVSPAVHQWYIDSSQSPEEAYVFWGRHPNFQGHGGYKL